MDAPFYQGNCDLQLYISKLRLKVSIMENKIAIDLSQRPASLSSRCYVRQAMALLRHTTFSRSEKYITEQKGH